MSSHRAVKRKAEGAVPEAEQEDPKKRAKKVEGSDPEEVDEGIPTRASDEEDEVDKDELAALDTTNVIEGGRRTRGVRVDYTKLNLEVEEEEEEDEETDEGANSDEGEEENVGDVDGKGEGDGDNEEEVQENVVMNKETNGYEEDDE